VNFTLEIGVVAEIVEVEASAQMLQTSNTSVGTVIDNERIVELPINGRNYLNLVKLSPNVSAEMQSGGQANSRQGGERANQSISIAGQRQQFNRYSLDGVENTDPNFNTFIIRPSVDAIQEFKVQTGVYSAEYGKASSQVIVTTKSGTNEFHGTAYEFLRNNAIQARDWNRAGDKAPYRRNQYGTTVTGPVVKNRIFFMANFEGLRESILGNGQATTPPVAMRNGDFSDPAMLGGVIFDPASVMEVAPGQFSGTPFANNIIPANRLSPIAQRLLEFYPEPNQPIGIGEGPNYFRSVPELLDWDQFTSRGDFVENSSSQWFYRYSWGREKVADGQTFEARDNRITTNVQQHALSNTRTFSPTLVNEFRLGVSLFDNDKLTKFNGIRDVSAELGIPGMPIPDPQAWGTPSVNVGGLNDFSGFGEASGGPFLNNNRNYQIVNNTSWIRGNHTFKFGIDISESRYAQVGNQFARGQFNSSNNQTSDPNNRSTTGNGFASFMTGWLNAATRAGGLPNVQFRRKPVMLYFEDTWKITPKLTMNIGLRYENTKPWHDKHSGYNNVLFHGCLGVDDTGIDESCQTPTLIRPEGINNDPFEGLAFHLADVVPVEVSDTALFSRSIVVWDTNDFAPRLGISYAPDGKTTIRFGYGMFYAQDTANPVFDMGRNFGARDTANNFNEVNVVNFEGGPWANKTPGNCSNWDGACFNGLYTFANDAGARTANVQQWVLNVQRQVTDTLMFEVGYLGSVGHNLRKMHGWNQIMHRSGPDDLTNNAQRRPWGDAAYGTIQIVSGLGNSNYHALGVKLLQRSNNGLTYLMGYTWGKSIDDTSAIRTNGGDNLFPANAYDFSSERGLSQFHTNHRLTASILYDLPLRFDNSLMEAIAGGWQAGTILTLSSGTPVGHNGFGCDTGGAGGRNDVTGINPNVKGGPEAFWSKGADGLQNSWACPEGDALRYRYGNAARNQLIAPGFANVDFSLNKNFAITETIGMELRFESYNFTNHPNWNTPNRSSTSTQYGRAVTARPMRINQFALKFNF
jgi:outer membrane receptor protein involved in Fe transport